MKKVAKSPRKDINDDSNYPKALTISLLTVRPKKSNNNKNNNNDNNNNIKKKRMIKR